LDLKRDIFLDLLSLSESIFLELLGRGTSEGARGRTFFLSLAIHYRNELTLLKTVVLKNLGTQIKELLAV
jgi:hypothetical protein